MERIQNKVAWALVVALSLLVIAALAGVVRGGPLDPNAPPGSTGKNVITQLPFTISQPGSWVFNKNLVGVSGEHGITVTAPNVTIDMQGFQLIGVSGAVAGINSEQPNLTLRNGTIRNWPIYGLIANHGLVVDSVVFDTNGSGISTSPTFGASAATITNCRVQGSGGDGIEVGNESIVENCISRNNTGDGIRVGQNSIIRDVTANNNGGEEIEAGSGAVVEDCVADGDGTGGIGILVGSNSIVRGCTARNNGGAEIYTFDDSLIEDCAADGWTGSAKGPGSGIVVWNRSVVRGCHARGNADGGIYVFQNSNRIESNHVSDNGTYGIWVAGTNFNIGLMNTAVNNIGAGNSCTDAYGLASSSTNSFPLAACSPATSTTGAWQNFRE